MIELKFMVVVFALVFIVDTTDILLTFMDVNNDGKQGISFACDGCRRIYRYPNWILIQPKNVQEDASSDFSTSFKKISTTKRKSKIQIGMDILFPLDKNEIGFYLIDILYKYTISLSYLISHLLESSIEISRGSWDALYNPMMPYSGPPEGLLYSIKVITIGSSVRWKYFQYPKFQIEMGAYAGINIYFTVITPKYSMGIVEDRNSTGYGAYLGVNITKSLCKNFLVDIKGYLELIEVERINLSGGKGITVAIGLKL